MITDGRLGLWVLAAAGAVVAAAGAQAQPPEEGAAGMRRVLVLGIDGMDPVLLSGLMDAGRMPTFARLAAAGSYSPLATSAPPQSPVAWSNFITGALPGTHEIYDFIHRDPNPPGGAVVMPYLSTSRTLPPRRDWAIPAGGWRAPLFGGRTELLRRGSAFWEDLARGGIDTAMGNPTGSDQIDQFYRRYPIPRAGRVEEIAQLALFLASDESSYSTGSEFVADGGWHAGDFFKVLPSS